MSSPCATDGNRKGRGESGRQPGEDLEPGAIWLLTLAAEAEGHTAGLNLGSVWYNEISVDLCVVVIPGFVRCCYSRFCVVSRVLLFPGTSAVNIFYHH